MVTAELALTFPAVVLVLLACLSAVSWGIDEVRCVDASRVAVREISRGEARSEALDHARGVAPSEAVLVVHRSGRDVTVSVSSPAPAALAWVGRTTSCSSTARMELVDAPA